MMESDHTPAAFSPPTTQGDTNLTQPSGEQPTSVEGHKLHFKGDTIDMKPYGDEQYNKGWEDGVARYIENQLPVEVAEESSKAYQKGLEDGRKGL